MDFERARHNMIEQQIRPWNVLDQDVLDLLYAVRREDFVPPAYRQLAFTDVEIPLVVDGEQTGETMLEPKVEARILQSLGLRKHESVLEIGTGSGYMAALLAHRARRVRSVEIQPSLARFAQSNLSAAGVQNCEVETRNGAEFIEPGEERFDVIVVSGGLRFVPDGLLDRLGPEGRCAVIVGQDPVMWAQIVRRLGPSRFATEALFETVAPPMIGFPQREGFRF
ncbi:MAG: protein-L-isoaspartate O-methyltransferase [Burkholderiaceae bacterium]|nr:protein-L-isoaspartate O-methyltransferase [Burkholderiaceae bacterium]